MNKNLKRIGILIATGVVAPVVGPLVATTMFKKDDKKKKEEKGKFNKTG